MLKHLSSLPSALFAEVW